MVDVEFFPFPSSKHPKLQTKLFELPRCRDFEPSRHDRICSMHFVDGKQHRTTHTPSFSVTITLSACWEIDVHLTLKSDPFNKPQITPTETSLIRRMSIDLLRLLQRIFF